MNNCSEFKMMLDSMTIPYEEWPAKIVVDITGVEQILLTELMAHLDSKGVEYSVDDTTMYVMPESMDMGMELQVDMEMIPLNNMPNETLGMEIELFARKFIPESEDAFGKFMYHAELIKNGHYEIHQMDVNMVQEPFRSILIQMIQKGGM
jgi:hypothetical protein